MGARSMSFHHVELRSAYADSVTLLQVSRSVQDQPGVEAAQVAMATALNIEVLTGMGFEVPAEATTNDLVVALRLTEEAELDAALAGVEQALAGATRRPAGPTDLAPPRTTASALRGAPGAVALVSVPGPSAMVEAMDAIDAGHDVMIFSDNVSITHELALKRAAADRGLLVMGPDCGTAVVDGVGLGFANVVSPGPVGIVAASGTGCQQVMALLDHAGVGITSALGVGGRDLSAEIGGLATMEALRRLDADPEIELIVLISKPPAPEVATAIEQYAATLATPVELALLGDGRPDLTAATEQVLRRLGWGVPDWPVADDRAWVGSSSGSSGHLRGLFVGGTLASEARLIATAALGTVGSRPSDLATGHAIVDFGDDELTSGRAHPMIDPTVRLEHLARVAADPATGVILLDVVLGHGAEPDPAASLVPAIEGIDKLVVITVVGTSHDPQGRARTAEALATAGAEVYLSNAHATRAALPWTGSPR